MLESKNNQTSVLELFCVCLSVLGWRLGCGWELDAPAHPYDKMYCVPASPFLFFSFFLRSFSSFFRGKNRRKCLFIFHFTHHLIQYHTHLQLGVIELGIGLIELGIGLRIHNARCTVLARVSGLVFYGKRTDLASLRDLRAVFYLPMDENRS